MEKKIFQKLAELISWNPPKGSEWVDVRAERIEDIMKTAPHGSGIDGDVTLIESASSASKIVIEAQYHTMNQDGYYGEWITAIITVTATLTYPGFEIDVQFEEDIEQINNDYYNEEEDYKKNATQEELDDYEAGCFNFPNSIDAEGIAEYIAECFYDWFLTECKEVK